ncbi:related to Tubulin-folding cofactor D [Sporisorium reilianum f. sp. reilianum]|uniref:Related to Tubulin-folding cofactor D n=1 Tax=Sporisorium reilianum f. sp. reilianum TaxID=72559 RepID=A0A2N8U5P0_9BASI|nr:related to Tubulin-folding cofactor D [Sporisorium reilianum f. sp. reilianum]
MVSSEAVAGDASAVVEEKELVRFERAQEFLSLLSSLVPPTASTSTSASSSSTNSGDPPISQDDILTKLVTILDEYQDQSKLLDPYLERIVSPPVESLQRHVRSVTQSQPRTLSDDSVTRLSKLVYAYTKVRGYKTIVHYFPHEVADLPATLSFLEGLQQAHESSGSESVASYWELRYVCLLWLSLICMIPFDLAKFDRSAQSDDETTASRIAAVANHFIASPGKERDAAAVVLGRLFQRNDVQLKDHFTAFLQSSLRALGSDDLSPFHATGILQALCEVLKTSEPAFVVAHLQAIQDIVDAYEAPHNASLAGNGLIIKYQTKLASRLALKLLRPRARRTANKFHVLGASGNTSPAKDSQVDNDDDDESDIPAETDLFISRLIDALQHKDTVVRYSAAKGVARLCDRLPTSFLTQVVDAIISLFHINIPNLSSSSPDLSSVSEHTWQGACMALAELSRRGLMFEHMLSEALPWIPRALLFDVRRGAHSVGASVRDAACYVVWALARSNDTASIRPHALELARKLVAVATLDRDVSIRRAASAAFQECVGRLALFPHGIDVIRMTDFYAVSVRRSAFLDCAVKVAAFEEYRGYLLDHLVDVVTVHWDPAMRRLGAQSVALVAMHDPTGLLPELSARLGRRIGTSDNAVLHGSLLMLAELSRLSRTLSVDDAATGERVRADCFGLLDAVRPSVFRSLGAASVLQAACQLIGAAFAPSTTSSPTESQTWETVLNLALARQEEPVHVAAAEAIAQLSTAVDLSSKIRSTLEHWSALTLPQQQSNTLWLGAIDFTRHPALFESVIDHLIALGQPAPKGSPNELYSPNIEVRRNAADSLTRAITSLRGRLLDICTAETLRKAVRSMLVGLQDYSTDQRGDVGSWVRLSCVAGLREVLILCRSAAEEVLTEDDFHEAVGGMWKQAAERIDHVRHAAGTSVLAVYHAYRSAEGIRPAGYDVVEAAYGAGCFAPFHAQPCSAGDSDSSLGQHFKTPSRAFPRLTRLLAIPRYCASILEGLVISVGSKTDLGERIIGPALSSTSLPTPALLNDIFDLAKRNFGDNRIFVPAVCTVSLVLENAPVLERVEAALARWVRMVLTNVARIKAVPRVVASATLCANVVLAIRAGGAGGGSGLLPQLAKAVQVFLTHSFPTVRVKFAEQLYAVLSSSVELDEEDEDKMDVWQQVETALLDTKWSAATPVDSDTVNSITAGLTRLLS